MSRLPTYFLSHGGGPWPWMKHNAGGAFDRLEVSLAEIPRRLSEQPCAVLVVTAHWEEPQFTVSSSARPPMVYDYYGFPEYSYRIRYAAPGSPRLAALVRQLLEAGGLPASSDGERGFDHGTFSLMQPVYPQADMPIVQLSLRAGLDPETHLRAGGLLAPLRDQSVLIIGSGSSYHNLRRWYAGGALPSRQFDAWLQQTLVTSAPAERRKRLVEWETAPCAREAHPREEHLLPLMVAVGAAEDEPGACIYHEDDFRGSISLSSFRFGDAARER